MIKRLINLILQILFEKRQVITAHVRHELDRDAQAKPDGLTEPIRDVNAAATLMPTLLSDFTQKFERELGTLQQRKMHPMTNALANSLSEDSSIPNNFRQRLLMLANKNDIANSLCYLISFYRVMFFSGMTNLDFYSVLEQLWRQQLLKFVNVEDYGRVMTSTMFHPNCFQAFGSKDQILRNFITWEPVTIDSSHLVLGVLYIAPTAPGGTDHFIFGVHLNNGTWAVLDSGWRDDRIMQPSKVMFTLTACKDEGHASAIATIKARLRGIL